jgi:alpha-beta hydrolase superfamily lysophospholipase
MGGCSEGIAGKIEECGLKKMNSNSYKSMILLISLLISQLATNVSAKTPAAPFDTFQLRKTVQPLSFSAQQRYSQPVLDYFRYYGLDHPLIPHYFGTFKSGPYTLAAQVYTPDSARGTVYLVHGYYDHTGILKNLIDFFLNEKYSVAAFDLPGHGLSSGAPASIDSFAEYGVALKDFIAKTAPNLPKPFSLLGHSTGCAAILDYYFKDSSVVFRDIILLAPLVRSAYWYPSKAGYAIAKPSVSTTPRWFRKVSADTAFLSWFARDPLQIRYFPVHWGTALYAWEKQITARPPRTLPITIIQGTLDNTVDWKYNIPFLKKKFPGCSVIFIKNGRHQLMNEAEPMRGETLECIRRVIRRE